MLLESEKIGFFEWVRKGGLDDPDVSNWLRKGSSPYRNCLDAYEYFVLKRREL